MCTFCSANVVVTRSLGTCPYENRAYNKAQSLAAIPLRSISAGELFQLPVEVIQVRRLPMPNTITRTYQSVWTVLIFFSLILLLTLPLRAQTTDSDKLWQRQQSLSVEELIKDLHNPNWTVRSQAAYVLGLNGDPRALKPLLEALDDDNWAVQYTAIGALRSIPDPQHLVVEPLINALSHTDSKIRYQAARALGDRGDSRAVKPLIRSLEDKDSAVRSFSATSLGQLRDVRAVEPLAKRLNDPDDFVRAYVALALGALRDTRAVDPLLYQLEHGPRYDLRFRAAEELGKLGDKRAVNGLIKALRANMSIIRTYAAEALGKLGDKSAIDALIKALGDPEIQTPANVLAGMGKQAFDPLVKALREGDSQTRMNAAVALEKIGDEQAIQALQEAVEKDPDRDVRNFITRQLQQHH